MIIETTVLTLSKLNDLEAKRKDLIEKYEFYEANYHWPRMRSTMIKIKEIDKLLTN